MTPLHLKRAMWVEQSVRKEGTILFIDTDNQLWILDPGLLSPYTKKMIATYHDAICWLIEARDHLNAD